MSASLTTSAAAASNTSTGSSSLLGGSRSASIAAGNALSHNLSTSAALFREIHKNTWLKRLTADGKKITVGPKKSERSWVVFCVHDDSQALLEGYAEPRQAASHNPEWVVSMQETQHISHALIPNSHEFEFVVTLSNEVIRFHAMSWEIMQEWVETLRSKLREMKILSPRENLYTKLPEIRAPLLPTRDPTSPLPAPPPVPAAMVPGVERVVPHSVLQSIESINTSTTSTSANEITSTVTAPLTTTAATSTTTNSSYSVNPSLPSSSSHTVPHIPNSPPTLTSMSNMLTQNLLNMLSDPITAYSEQLHGDEEANTRDFSDNFVLDSAISYSDSNEESLVTSTKKLGTNPNEIAADSVSNEQQTDAGTENSVRVDIGSIKEESNDQSTTMDYLIQCERLIPRPQTYRSLSIGAVDKTCKQLLNTTAAHQNAPSNSTTVSKCNNNITELEISSEHEKLPVVTTTTTATDPTTNITIIQVTNINENLDAKHFNNNRSSLGNEGDIFKFPEGLEAAKPHDEYKSNVQIIPSNLNSSTIQVMGQNITAVANQYSTPIKKSCPPTSVADVASTSSVTSAISSPRSHLENHKITTVHVNEVTASTPSIYGTCYTETPGNVSIPTLPKKIILTANSSGVTNITVNNVEKTSTMDSGPKSSAANSDVKHNVGNVRYEKVFLSSSIPIASQEQTEAACKTKPPLSRESKTPKLTTQRSEVHRQSEATSSIKFERLNLGASSSSSLPSSPTPVAACSSTAIGKQKLSTSMQVAQPAVTKSSTQHERNPSAISMGSPLLQRKRVVSVSPVNTDTNTPPVPTRPRFLTRGLTEAVITARPSRKDFCQTKVNMKPKPESSSNPISNNNGEATTSAGSAEACPQTHSAISRTRSESLEQRRRSSSTSEAQSHRTRAANNNEIPLNRGGPNVMRMQQPPHPFRSVENGPQCSGVASPSAASPAAKRMTLREQQVMQLRREIMHPGGVRLQLRRKDCVGSIAWVDAFGAIWVAGWKQKEHPVLYNALHIGDQLISVAGVAVSTAAETNKIIRNTNTLFVEVLIRRIPFGRGYAIRREREGQCLGLIRDGNTSTIVDVVPNSLAARHGLPPKAQSCDGSTLTFWVLTEINGRPLNLFFKENEIRDRLNSVGRDISILVQPSDLITKLKKQLKSLRGYKDYLVQ